MKRGQSDPRLAKCYVHALSRTDKHLHGAAASWSNPRAIGCTLNLLALSQLMIAFLYTEIHGLVTIWGQLVWNYMYLVWTASVYPIILGKIVKARYDRHVDDRSK